MSVLSDSFCFTLSKIIYQELLERLKVHLNQVATFAPLHFTFDVLFINIKDN